MFTILVVEDHPIMRPTLRDLLRLEGYTVVTAMHGFEALDRLRVTPVDLVITNFALPELDGLELLKIIRADVNYQNLPVLVFTAIALPEVRGRVMAAGANDFLLRPITPQMLFEAISYWLAPQGVGEMLATG
ncbi:MAG TPA: response regulator [Thermoflexia bacterium]|nr:response regulator [Thermoflexia bacterium]